MTLISLVVPCYNEEATVPIYFKTVQKILKNFKKNTQNISGNTGLLTMDLRTKLTKNWKN